MSLKDVPVQVILTSNNRAGGVFSNLEYGLTVIRWESHSNLSHCVDLMDTAFQELSMAGTDTLVFDMRAVQRISGGIINLALIQQALTENLVRRFIQIGNTELLLAQPATTALLNLADSHQVETFFANDFAEASRWLNEQRGLRGRLPLESNLPNFSCTYGGVTYSIPEYGATVLRMSGDTHNYRLVKHVLYRGLKLHRATGAKVCIVDSSLCPPIAHDWQYTFLYRELVQPLTSGICERVIHVRRAGDVFSMRKGAPSIERLVTSLGVPCFEVGTMQEAITLLNALEGREPGTYLAQTDLSGDSLTLAPASRDI